MNVSGVFFDLDGTLADTAPDLAAATNQLLLNHGQPALPHAQLRPFVSGGSPALIKIAFGLTPKDQGFESLKQEFLDIYEKAYLVETKLFKGIEESLTFLEQKQIPWGIVTNKPAYLANPLLKDMGLFSRASVVIGGDTYPVKKPDPFPLIEACKLSETVIATSIYVGDDERDILAARAANMPSVCAEWGYLANQDPSHWRADYYLKKSTDLTGFLRNLID